MGRQSRLLNARCLVLWLSLVIAFIWLFSGRSGSGLLEATRLATAPTTDDVIRDEGILQSNSNNDGLGDRTGEDGGAWDDKSPVLFVDVYSEQIGRSVNNFARLLTLTNKMGYRLAVPFVHNSRLSGMRRQDIRTPQAFSQYFDLRALNGLLADRGMAQLATYAEVASRCSEGWDLIVLLQQRDAALSRPEIGNKRNVKAEVDACRQAAERSPGATADCPVLLRLARLLPEQRRRHKRGGGRGKAAAAASLGSKSPNAVRGSRGVVIDASRFHNIAKLGRVLSNAKCPCLLEWAGEGDRRALFTGLSDADVRNQIHPYEIRHSEFVLGKAREFIRASLGPDKYVAVHVRMEKLLKFGKTVVQMRHCLQEVAQLAAKLQARSAAGTKVFLTTDLGDDGSDTIARHIGEVERREMQSYAQSVIRGAVVPGDFELTDRGARAMTEMEIAASASDLITVGGGNFQEWMKILFLLKNHRTPHKLCLQTSVPSGWEFSDRKVTT